MVAQAVHVSCNQNSYSLKKGEYFALFYSLWKNTTLVPRSYTTQKSKHLNNKTLLTLLNTRDS